jgi:hypothetical protein
VVVEVRRRDLQHPLQPLRLLARLDPAHRGLGQPQLGAGQVEMDPGAQALVVVAIRPRDVEQLRGQVAGPEAQHRMRRVVRCPQERGVIGGRGGQLLQREARALDGQRRIAELVGEDAEDRGDVGDRRR